MTAINRKNPDGELREAAEWGVISLIYNDNERASRLLSEVSATLAAPLHQWFAGRATRAIAVALDASLRGEGRPDHAGVGAYLAGLPHDTLHEILTGKPPAPWKAVEFENSALEAIGGYSALSAPESAQESTAGTATGWAVSLRHLVERERIVEGLRTIAIQVAKSSLKDGPSGALGAGIERLASLLSGGGAGRNLGDCALSAVDAAIAGEQQRANGGAPPATWGVPELDALCPLRPGRLIILSAPPGAGKTSLALQSAAETARESGRGGVAVASLEMSGEELATILAARELQISPSAIRDWTPAAARREAEIRELGARWNDSKSMLIRDLEDGQRQNAATISSWFRQRKTLSGGRLALGVLDYIGLLEGEPRATEYQTITHATRAMKRSALSLQIPLLCLAQLNREGRKADRNKQGEVGDVPEPRMEDLRGSGSLEQDADAVVFIHLPGQRNPGPMVRGKIIVAKNRGGATGSVDVVFNRRHQLFIADLASENKALPNIKMSQQPSDNEDYFNA